MATFDTEIRKLQPIELCTLAQYLDESSYWRKLMAAVPKDNDENASLFNHDHFRMIEQAIGQQKRSGAEIFLSEWSTLNRRRPTCKLLLDLLVKIQFFKAADYLAVDVLKIDPPERPKQGPGAPVDISDEMLERMLRAGLGTDTDTDMSYSLHYAENPAELIPAVQAEKEVPPPEQISYPPMMLFTEDRSDMIKFISEDDLKKPAESVPSETKLDVEKVPEPMPTDVETLPERVSSVMKVGDDDDDILPTYGLPVMESGNIPVCVNDSEAFSADQVSADLSTATQSTISSASSIINSDSTQPTASESDIPIAVLKYSKNDT